MDKLCDSRSDESSSEQRDADNTMNETTEFVDLERKVMQFDEICHYFKDADI